MNQQTAPPGLNLVTCHRCGLPVWLARLDPQAMVKAGYRGTSILLIPGHSERGNVQLNQAGRAVFTGRYPGNLERHRCPARVASCKYCRGPVRVLGQPPGEREALAVVDADPDPDGIVVVNEHGYAVRDPDYAVPGARYRWHSMHGAGGH